MTAAWMVFSILVGTLLAFAALGAERVARAIGQPTRWVWSAALALTVALTAVAPWRRAHASAPASTYATVVGNWTAVPTASPSSVVAAAGARIVEAVASAVPAPLQRRLGALWLLLSGATLLGFAMVYLRVRRARRGWPLMEIHDCIVRVAPRTGPAVMGVVRPEIVVPTWLLRRVPNDQRLVIEHEREHVRAGDSRLLAAGCAAAVLLPWHPVVWWMLSRLRLAVELDCDRRVLARGAGADAYGSLLIELASHGPSLSPAALALAAPPSHLERRLIAMTTPRPKVRLHTMLIAAAALAAVIAACESGLPTQSARATNANAASAQALVNRAATVGAVALRVQGLARAGQFPADGRRHDVEATPADRRAADSLTLTFNGLVFVDGVQRQLSALSSIGANGIARIDVLKGPATKLYSDPRAANGVILVTTKAATR